MASIATRQDAKLERFVFYGVGWEGYQSLLKMVDNRRVRVTYDRGDVELMAPLAIHELYKKAFGRLVDIICEELDIPVIAQGSTTFQREDLDRGLEPDECIYLASIGQIHDRKALTLDIDPPPDLAIEVDITSSSLDRQGIYAALGVREIWRFDGETLRVFCLTEAGVYQGSDKSRAFPFLPMAEVARMVREADPNNDIRWIRDCGAWFRDEVVSRNPDLGQGQS
jgi:Uma2 family endonuclease